MKEIEQEMKDTPSPFDSKKRIGSAWGLMRGERLDFDRSKELGQFHQSLADDDFDSFPIEGFHAVPSMKHVHLHVISTDLVSDRLKHKKQ